MRTGRPTKIKIEPGQTFGKLTTIKLNGQDKHGRKLWQCRCECGNLADIKGTYLANGVTKSCGCEKYSGLGRLVHGHKPESGASKIYRCWVNMIRRCTIPTVNNWHRYGGRGITVCDRWADSFENFLADMGEPPTKAHSIDRVDNDGNYEPGNCVWADRLTQRKNSSSPLRWVSINGENLILKEAVARYSTVPYATVLYRIRRGWGTQAAILKPKLNTWSRKRK